MAWRLLMAAVITLAAVLGSVSWWQQDTEIPDGSATADIGWDILDTNLRDIRLRVDKISHANRHAIAHHTPFISKPRRRGSHIPDRLFFLRRDTMKQLMLVLLVTCMSMSYSFADDEYDDDDVKEYYQEIMAVLQDRKPAMVAMIRDLPNRIEGVDKIEIVVQYFEWAAEIMEEYEEHPEPSMLTHLDLALQVAHDELAIHHYVILQSQAGKSADKPHLSKLVTALFESKLVMHRHEIQELKSELREHEQKLEKARENRESIIAKRVQELAGDESEDFFDW